MSDKVFSDEVIKKCVSDLLPSEVMFAMGDGEKVECASIWINKLQRANEELLAKIKEQSITITGFCTSELEYETKIKKLQRANEKLLENLKPWKDECLKLRKEIKIYELTGQQNIELIGQNFELKKELDREHRTVHELIEQIGGWAKRQRELLAKLDKCQTKLNTEM